MSEKTRSDLYKDIWNISDRLRGSVDGWDFKNYVLGFLFYKYISEDFADCVEKELVASGDDACNYADCKDEEPWIDHMKESFVEKKGYFIYPSQLFSRIRKDSQNNIDNLNEILDQVFKDIESSTQDSSSKEKFQGLFKLIDLNSIKLGQEISQRNRRLKEVIDGIAEMQVNIKDSTIYGDAFKHLIGMYASNAGKSGGEFYTPPEVSQLLANLASEGARDIRTVYDPACGSGSLLLKLNSKENVEFYGQEINRTTYDLCRMNMFLHKVNFSKFDIQCGDTLMDDHFGEMKFDIIVSNPPYSSKWISKDDPTIREDKRFYKAGGIAPKSAADFAFIQTSLFHLAEHGTAAMVCFPGILYRERAEQDIRKWFIENNHIDAIIQLPEKLFYGTTIATCIMVLKKSKTDTDVVFIDATNCFEKAKNRNILKEENIQQIMNLYKDRKDVETLAKVVTAQEIREKDYNLSVDAYVVKENKKEEINIEELNKSIAVRTEKINQLRREIDLLISELENI